MGPTHRPWPGTTMGSRRYDSRTTTFSPEGRLYQVEYAMEAISHAGTAIGILGTDGVVLAAEKKISSKLLEPAKSSEKMYMIDDHVACAVAGITADANILINQARLYAGWDKTWGFQLYASDPSGNYGGWKATSIGANSQAAQSLMKQEYKADSISLDEALKLAIKVLTKTCDSTTLTPDKFDLATVTLVDGKVKYTQLSEAEAQKLLDTAKEEQASGDA